MPATPKKGRRFGGSSSHQKSMMANLVASLIAAEAITTTEAKAKALRPVAEKIITKAKKGGLHNHRQVVSFLRDREMARKLFDEIKATFHNKDISWEIIFVDDSNNNETSDIINILQNRHHYS